MKLKALVALAIVGLLGAITAGTALSSLQSPSIDISGPCDEAEHANDPECAGIALTGADSSPSPQKR